MDKTDSRLAHSPGPASDDVASHFNSIASSDSQPPPWEVDPPEEAGRQRHDAFTGAKKQLYLKALARHGCILDACRITGVSSSTVYNHQSSDPEFARYCQMAVDMASTPLELTAYERAVVGLEEDVIRGGKVVGTRVRRSDYMLRVLLQGADPRKYGARPGFSRKRLLKAERKKIEQEVRAEMAEPRMSFEDAIKELDKALDSLGMRTDAKRLEEGWTDLGGSVWIPPGWVWTGEGDPAEAVAGLAKKDDAVCNSSSSSTSPEEEEEGEGSSLRPRPEPETTAGRSVDAGAPEHPPGSVFMDSGLRRNDDTPPPSCRRRPASMNTDVREPDPPCSPIPDQARNDGTPPPSCRRRPASMNTDVREPDPPCSPIPDQARDDDTPPPSFRRRPESMNTEAWEPDPPCSWIADQVRDDDSDPPYIQTPPSRHPWY